MNGRDNKKRPASASKPLLEGEIEGVVFVGLVGGVNNI